MQLCIDALDVFYTRSEIQSFVLVAGDRDYIPLIKHLKKHGRLVRVVGFPRSVSGDLRMIVGDDYFIDATLFIREPVPGLAQPKMPLPGVPVVHAPPSSHDGAFLNDLDSYETTALDTMFLYFRDKREIWLSPYLHRLRAALPSLAEAERKALVTGLSEKGAIKIVKRPGESPTGEKIEFSVIKVQWNHPDVQRFNT
jgi:hypothetical protein